MPTPGGLLWLSQKSYGRSYLDIQSFLERGISSETIVSARDCFEQLLRMCLQRLRVFCIPLKALDFIFPPFPDFLTHFPRILTAFLEHWIWNRTPCLNEFLIIVLSFASSKANEPQNISPSPNYPAIQSSPLPQQIPALDVDCAKTERPLNFENVPQITANWIRDPVMRWGLQTLSNC